MLEKESKIEVLFKEIQQGSKSAFNELYHIYYSRLLFFAKQYTKEEESAEEIVSSLFVRLWIKRDNLVVILNPEVYLYVAVKNASLNFIRSTKRRLVLLSEEDKMSSKDTFENNCRSSLEEKELVKLLAAAVAALPEQRRIIFKLIKEDGLTAIAVAKILGLSKRTVENQLYKAVKTLAEAASEYLGYNPQTKLSRKKPLYFLSAFF